ncbi:MAG: Fe-S protein assembly co-chaperone HscB [Taibaiella sp.]|nr:Fe-S protein assembly co-chaperone HscB [Taibaiella sp.]
MVNYFELYGLPVSFHPDPVIVKSKYYELSRKYHPDRFTLATPVEQAEALQQSSINNQAWKTLNSPDATMAYVLRLEGVLENEEKYSLPAAFLVEMMDLNEMLSYYEMDGGDTETLDKARKMLADALREWEEETRHMTEKYDNGDHSNNLLRQIKEQYFRKKYLLRIQERMNSFATR